MSLDDRELARRAAGLEWLLLDVDGVLTDGRLCYGGWGERWKTFHVRDGLPRVAADTPMREAIYEMSKKGLGITAVTDGEGRLTGCISDGDLRRLLEHDGGLLQKTAGECARPRPKTIDGNELAGAALKKMEDNRITSLFVCDPEGRLAGIVHLHDLWGLELF